MTPEAIAKFVETEKLADNKLMKFDFKKRNSIAGILIQGKDYEDLKAKNFWRIVTHANLTAWKKTNSLEFAKIYSGTDFNKITVVDAKAVA
ncbi:MAG TPA: short-chain dehydrogenase [Chitinophagaceae bacterium]